MTRMLLIALAAIAVIVAVVVGPLELARGQASSGGCTADLRHPVRVDAEFVDIAHATVIGRCYGEVDSVTIRACLQRYFGRKLRTMDCEARTWDPPPIGVPIRVSVTYPCSFSSNVLRRKHRWVLRSDVVAHNRYGSATGYDSTAPVKIRC